MEEKAGAEEDTHQVLKVLEALKQASHELQIHPTPNSDDSNSSSSAINALLELQTESDSILSNDPNLSTLSHHLSNLKSLISNLHVSQSRHGCFRSFLTRRVRTHEISRLAGSIESEIQAWIDRKTMLNLTRAALQLSASSSTPLSSYDEEKFIETIDKFMNRISQGFSSELQDLILKSNVFSKLDSVLCRVTFSKRVREKSAFAIAELLRFNKDVFVGQVLMGQAVRALVSMGSVSSLEVMCWLIKVIKSPLVDDLDSNGEIKKIIGYLSADDLRMKMVAMDCVLEIGYYGRREAIEAMVNGGLIKKLVELQRLELGGELIDVGWFEEEEEEEEEKNGCGNGGRERRFRERERFGSCVARFGVEVEVGEGLREREKREFKKVILKRVREASVSDAEAATIIADLLWASSP